ncbi:MAG: ubiquitinyl hydrolase 1 [Sclerophora amabilis]|nr:MAG: ubiquitinyl hydrolase 1 [Sclerophora amabilis]
MSSQATQNDVPTASINPAKAFVPLENNPEVMTSLVHKLGLSRTLSFADVYSISDPDLLSFLPRPSYALLLVFPVSTTYERHRHSEDAPLPEYEGKGAGEEVMWFKQTIKNACGLIGLLHAVANGEARNLVEPKTPLSKLLDDATPLAPSPRASLLYDSQALESAHQAAASLGDTVAPSADDPTELHYVCFTKSTRTNHLWELDGRRKGPLDRGPLKPDEDVLSEKALDLGVRAFLKREEEEARKSGGEEGSGAGELRFSVVSLGPSLD